MPNIDSILQQHIADKIMIYGLGTETERFLGEWGDRLDICGLLDGFREDGEMFGYPVLPHKAAVDRGVRLIIVVARPGSCKAIAKRIGGMCRENGIALYDVRGKDLLYSAAISFDLSDVNGQSKATLMEEISQAEIVSFDLFDTLVTRKVYSYTDVFELVDAELRRRDVVVPDLPKLRLMAEKQLSKEVAPTLTEIYEEVLNGAGVSAVTASELAALEYNTDLATMMARDEVRSVFNDAVASGKRVIITTDSYYSQVQIRGILDKFGIEGYEKLLVSCECGTSKTQKLFGEVAKLTPDCDKTVHIGDDVAADIEAAGKYGIKSFRVFSGMDLFDALGGMGAEASIESLSDRVKTGLFIARLFNSPFWFDSDDRKVAVGDAHDVGYLFCGPMIADFILWMKERVHSEEFRQILFGARDGYLVKKLYEKVDAKTRSEYFLTSRTAAIRAGMESEEDIEYVSSMKFSGSAKDALKVRFGVDDSSLVLEKARNQRANYKRYIDGFSFSGDKFAMFDFVAKGTTQLFLGKLFDQHLKGFYFLQLEPEFMADRGLDIEPFYTEEEKNSSAIYDNYYILETMLTAPYPQLLEFDQDGTPVYAKETRSKEDIACFERMQAGIEAFFGEFTELLPEPEWRCNKPLDEAFLTMINKIRISDEDFNKLKVEDPFFGRMTDVKDVIG
ncbi:MAG: HAD hydrolase-like protein [Butyrivibrio sp.]|nr:HAD hydrolase-like protein [Butyrivibrio sp.]